MGQLLTGLWDRAQGKQQIRRICDKIFEQIAGKDKDLLVDKLHIATLRVYSSVNKQFLSPYKDPPPMETIEKKIETLKEKPAAEAKAAEDEAKAAEAKAAEDEVQKAKEKTAVAKTKAAEVKAKAAKVTITKKEFYDIIMEWIQNDMRFVLANRILLALLAAPLLAIQTKSVGRQVPRIGNVVDKVPTPVIASVYSVGLVLLQDIRVD